MASKNLSPLALLHISNNWHDRLVIEAAIHSITTRFQFHGADGIDAAMHYFAFTRKTRHPLGDACPALVLLDYTLGLRCGADFLYWLRIMHGNTVVPVVMYSNLADRDCVRECYANGANHFLRKARSLTRTEAVVRALDFCFYLKPPRFECLELLPESEPDPRVTKPVAISGPATPRPVRVAASLVGCSIPQATHLNSF